MKTKGGKHHEIKHLGNAGKVTIHTEPGKAPAEHLAVLLSTLSNAFALGQKLPGTTWPIHVVVEWGGTRCCGTVEPAEGPGAKVDVSAAACDPGVWTCPRCGRVWELDGRELTDPAALICRDGRCAIGRSR